MEPEILPMTDEDIYLADLLEEHEKPCSFYTLLKTKLILKNRIAAVRANRELTKDSLKYTWRPSRVAVADKMFFDENDRKEKNIEKKNVNNLSSLQILTKEKRKDEKKDSFDLTSSPSSCSSKSSSAESNDQYNGNNVKFSSSMEPSSTSPTSSYSTCQNQNHDSSFSLVYSLDKNEDDLLLLPQRIAQLKCRIVKMKGDGNCQFRAASYNLYGHEELYDHVRKKVVKHMKKCSEDYSVYFENNKDFIHYLQDMERDRTWGDELTIRGIADAFGCIIHIVTSTKLNWYLKYTASTSNYSYRKNIDNSTDRKKISNNNSIECIKEKKKKNLKHLFFTYISPIHYNAFTIDHSFFLKNN